MARGALGLAEWAVITENLESVRELKPLQESFTEWLPTSIHYRTSEADGNIVSRAGNTIRSVTPLPVAPTLPVIPADVFIKDQATGLQVRSGGLDALEITKVRKVLSYSATGAPLDGGEGRSARCGPDCLTYMLWLTDKSPAPADVLRLFNGVEDGVTLLEIRDAAQKIGLRLIGLRGIDGGLENLQLPAILSTTNTHFVVAVSATKNGFVVIDPPYTVRIVSSDELSKLWSGYALTLEGSEG